VVHGEARTEFGGHFGSEYLRQRLLAMNVEIVHYQMNRLGGRVGQRQGDGLGEFKARTIRRREGEMTTRFRLYRSENIGRAAGFVFVIACGFPPRLSRRRGTNIGVQRDGLLVSAHHRLLRVVRLFVRL
jgi:hypothetical protein